MSLYIQGAHLFEKMDCRLSSYWKLRLETKDLIGRLPSYLEKLGCKSELGAKILIFIANTVRLQYKRP
jgi:hypothetical protein